MRPFTIIMLMILIIVLTFIFAILYFIFGETSKCRSLRNSLSTIEAEALAIEDIYEYCTDNEKWDSSDYENEFSIKIDEFKKDQKEQGLDLENNTSCNIAGWAIGKEGIDLLETIANGATLLREEMQDVCDLYLRNDSE